MDGAWESRPDPEGSKEDAMAKYLVEASYTREGVAGVQAAERRKRLLQRVKIALSGDGKPRERLAAVDVVGFDVLQDAGKAGRVGLRVRDVRWKRRHERAFACLGISGLQLVVMLFQSQRFRRRYDLTSRKLLRPAVENPR